MGATGFSNLQLTKNPRISARTFAILSVWITWDISPERDDAKLKLFFRIFKQSY